MTYTLPCLKSSISFEKLLPRRELESSGLAERVLEQSSERRKSYYSSQTKRQLYTASKNTVIEVRTRDPSRFAHRCEANVITARPLQLLLLIGQ